VRSSSDENELTLSVCLVIGWPAPHLVARAAKLKSASEILRALIELFERLHCSPAVVASRSRIEDGRFVGWLSYPNVLTAQDAFLSLRDALQSQSLAVKLQTVDQRVPFAWPKRLSGTGHVAGKLSPGIGHVIALESPVCGLQVANDGRAA